MRYPTDSRIAETELRAERFQRQLQHLAYRDLQLWSIGVLLIVVLAAGLLALTAANVFWKPGNRLPGESYLPQLFYGLISLIVLFNVYVIGQKRTMRTAQVKAVRDFVYQERLESVSLVDPLTKLLNRRALDEIAPKEIARANRLGAALTFVALDLGRFQAINQRFGHQAGDRLLTEAAHLIRTTFRGSDTVLRLGADEFLVLMPDTAETQAECAVQRLLREVDHWNIAAKANYEMSLSWCAVPYVMGAKLQDLLDSAESLLSARKPKIPAGGRP